MSSKLSPRMDSQPSVIPVTLTARQQSMITYFRASETKKSVVAPAFFLFSCFGKLVFGYGASLTVKGICANDTVSIAVGGVLCGVGFICIVIVAFGFGAACSQIDRTRGIILKCISISAAVLIAAGYSLNQYSVSEHHSLNDIRLSFIPLFLGAAFLTISLSNFTAYTELVRGRSRGVPVRKRPLFAMCMLGPGLGTVFAGWITGEKGEWPVVFNAAVLTIAMACLYGGICIFWSDHLHQEAELCALQHQQTLAIEAYNHENVTRLTTDLEGKNV